MPLPILSCINCGERIKPKLVGNRLTIDRSYCSSRCKDLKAGGYSKQARSKRARKFLKDRCEACGDTRELIVHHIDQDNSNNDPKNIMTLDRTCHDFIHSAAKRVGRAVAGRMPWLWDTEDERPLPNS